MGLLLKTTSVSEAQDIVVIPDELACSACVIDVREIVRFGDADGPAALPSNPAVALDSAGRFWLTFFEPPILIFAADGGLARALSRPGDGPGELRYPRQAISIGDSIAVYEQIGRVTVFGPDLRAVRVMQWPAQPWDAAIIQWPDTVVLNVFSPTPAGAGFPFHLVDLSGNQAELRTSFGPDPRGNITPFQLRYLQMRLLVRNRTVFAADRLRYRITQWTPEGVLQKTWLRQPRWFEGMSSGTPGRPDAPPEPEVIGIFTDRDGLLWVYSRVPKEGWEQAWERVIAAVGTPPAPSAGAPVAVSPSFMPGPFELYGTMIEVLDLERRMVVARLRLEEHVTSVLSDGRMSAYNEPQGIPTVRILEASIRR